jgi:hypothetical protein
MGFVEERGFVEWAAGDDGDYRPRWRLRERLHFTPDAQQESVPRGRRLGIVNRTLQWGESTVTAAKAAHRAYSVGGSLTLVVIPPGVPLRTLELAF